MAGGHRRDILNGNEARQRIHAGSGWGEHYGLDRRALSDVPGIERGSEEAEIRVLRTMNPRTDCGDCCFLDRTRT